MCIHPHFVANLSSQQFVNRHAEKLALDVPERLFDCRNTAHPDYAEPPERLTRTLSGVKGADQRPAAAESAVDSAAFQASRSLAIHARRPSFAITGSALAIMASLSPSKKVVTGAADSSVPLGKISNRPVRNAVI